MEGRITPPHSKKSSKNYLFAIIAILFILVYIYASTLPKHGDFWVMSYTAKTFAEGKVNFYEYILRVENKTIAYVAYPPPFYVMQGLWIKLLASLSIIDLFEWKQTVYKPFQPFGLFIHLIFIILAVIISFKILENKLLSLLWLGMPTFVSVIVMGQVDIFSVFFLYLALISSLKGYKMGKSNFHILSFIFLGISTWFKPYTLMLTPFLLFFELSSTQNLRKKFGLAIGSTVILFSIFMFPWVFYWSELERTFLSHSVITSESVWILKMQIVSPVKQTHAVSIWLFGYLYLVYSAFRSFIDGTFKESTFRFYVFATVCWFFATSYTHPQWHLFLIPPMAIILDRFPTRLNFCLVIVYQIIFYIYSMRYSTWEILKYYLPSTLIAGDVSVIICTMLSFLLIIWILETKKYIKEKLNRTL